MCAQEEALARAYEKRSHEKRNAEAAAQRYAELAGAGGGGGGGAGGRPDLGLRLSDYHLGLLTDIGNSRGRHHVPPLFGSS